MLNTIRQNLRSFLRIPENITAGLPTISASRPTASLGGNPPEMSFTRPALAAPSASAAPVAAAAPKFRRAPIDAEGFTQYQRKMQHEARLKIEFGFHERLEAAGMKTDLRRKVLAEYDRFVAARPLGKAVPKSGTVDDEGNIPVEIPTAADPVGDVIKQLEQCLKQLKEAHADVSADDADSDEAEAKACLARGDKNGALRRYDAAISKWGAKITAKKSRNPILSEPSSPQRAHRLTASGYNAMPTVATLNASLGRGRPSSPSLPPVVERTPPARPAPAARTISAPPDVAKIHSIKAELAQLDIEQRKEFSNARNDKHAALSRQLNAELRKFHVS